MLIKLTHTVVWDDVQMILGKEAEVDTSVAKAILSRKWMYKNI